tara:strand:+ start:111 stop:299 length:189 start_codon:yes stop_codon:yes gene_type:complete
MRGFSAWLLGTYRKIRYFVIVIVVLSLVLWYFNSVLFYDIAHGAVDGTMATGNIIRDFVTGF